jgi:transposase
MAEINRFVGLDVHSKTITAAIAEKGGEVRQLGIFPNRMESVRRFVKKLGKPKQLAVCYEAGPTGYVLYWQLTKMGIQCEVVAPSLVPRRSGDKVKTDRRDAERLARSYRAGDLTPVWVPDAAHEALRELVRCREAAKRDQLRARHRFSKLMLRYGKQPPEGVRNWSWHYEQWLKGVRFEEGPTEVVRVDLLTQVQHQTVRIEQLDQAIEKAIQHIPDSMREVIDGLQSLRGVAKLTAVTIVAELGQVSRFPKARQLMSYAGLVPREYSSGGKVWHGAITKSGNGHLRRVVVEAAWSYRYPPNLYRNLKKRQEGLSPEVKVIAWKAQHRLHQRYRLLSRRGKEPCKVAAAVARELLGFIWAIAKEIEQEQRNRFKQAA